MENVQFELTTASGMLAAYDALTVDATVVLAAESAGLLVDLARLFASRPVGEIGEACIATKDFSVPYNLLDLAYDHFPANSMERRLVVEKGVGLVDVCLGAEEFVCACSLLDRAFNYYALGSPEQRQVVEKGVTIVDACIAAKEFDLAFDLLDLAYDHFPSGSREECQVVERQLAIVDTCITAKDFSVAYTLLDRGLEHFPSGSREQHQMMERRQHLQQVLGGMNEQTRLPNFLIQKLEAAVSEQLARATVLQPT